MRISGSNMFQNAGLRLNNQNSPFLNATLQTGDKIQKKDTLTIGQGAKKNSVFEQLAKQRENITKQKYDLIGRTLEKGGSMESIKGQLEVYDEQLKNLDIQMKQALMEQKEKKEENNGIKNEPKTEEELQAQRMNRLLQSDNSLEQAEVITSVKERTEGEIKVLKSEISLDGDSVLDSKVDQLADLEGKLHNLTMMEGKGLAKANEERKESVVETTEIEKDATAAKELSEEAQGQITEEQESAYEEE